MEFSMLAAVMRNHITWRDNGDQEPCLDIDVNLEVTLEVCIHTALQYIT